MDRQKRFMRRLSLMLPMELIVQIREVARVRGVSMTQVVREAIQEMLFVLEKDDQNAEKLRESLRSSQEF